MKQSDLLKIDSEKDFISDKGDEVWNVLADRGIQNVILTGVHTNMCVIGRPFGLRQMIRHGKNAVLMRDMTDTMYNPERWPYVSHFSGTDLIVSHIERFVCPTISSQQILGGDEFRFKEDKRPHVAIVIGEKLYDTSRSLPKFANDYLGKQFRVSFVFADEEKTNEFPGLEVLDSADLAIISVRRRTLRPERLAIIKRFVDSKKPVIGIRTASHAFSSRKAAPQGFISWTEFDAAVWGGSYAGHHANDLKSMVTIHSANATHPILNGVAKTFPQGGSLYKPAPLQAGARLLISGTVEDAPAQPVAWTFQRASGGESFYTSLGDSQDFEHPDFIRLFLNAIQWATKVKPAADLKADAKEFKSHWSLISVPSRWAAASEELKNYRGQAWYRCAVRLRDTWMGDTDLQLEFSASNTVAQGWFNGNPMTCTTLSDGTRRFSIKQDWVEINDANFLVLNVGDGAGDRGWQMAPTIRAGDAMFKLKGRWQFRVGSDPAWTNIPLPARYGTSSDIVFEPTSDADVQGGN